MKISTRPLCRCLAAALLLVVPGKASAAPRQNPATRAARGAGPDETDERPGRDPFQPPAALPEAPRPSGLRGVRVREVLVRGIVRFPRISGGAADLAILESPDGDGFVVRPGAELLDGFVHRVEPDGVAFVGAGDPETEVFRPMAAREGAAGERR